MKFIDLFCGAGGLSQGFIDEGFEPILAIDNDIPSVEHYNSNVAEVALCMDVKEVDMKEFDEADIIIGGPPCQGFSIAGKRLKADPRSSLSIYFAKFVNDVKPNWFVMENVDGLLSLEYRNLIEKKLRENFQVQRVLLDAVKYGAPQFRKRLFFIGRLKGNSGIGLLEAPLPPDMWKTVRDALPDYEFPWYYRHPRTYGRRGVYSVDEPSPTIRTVNRPMPKTYRRHKNDAPYELAMVRALTAEERGRIQFYPHEFEWKGTKAVKNTLIGNAVPPIMAQVVARAILRSQHNS